MYVSSDCNDLPTYIPFMEKYYQAYGEYLKKHQQMPDMEVMIITCSVKT
ncbi:hypothetical protein SD457_14045 [Coprobacillaceae bacterium CR2/5/TPMF4]|nr:hypothetical protein SD457_14045 [Coprobacillaceae bacterium CR2/5/TPMF4]